MTETARRLSRLARPHARTRSLAIGLATAGAGLAAAAGGIALAPHLTAITAAWIALPLVIVAGLALARRLSHGTRPASVSRMVESAAGAREGSVSAMTSTAAAGTSAALFADADRRAAGVVERVEPAVHAGLRRATVRTLAIGSAAGLLGAALFIAARPASARASAFWHPLRAFAASRAPLDLVLDKTRIHRGERVIATIAAPGAVRATLWTRSPGESWTPTSLILDSTGRTAHALGPLATDLFVRATSGARASAELRVSVATPAFVADVGLTARYPAYLDRADEPLIPSADTISIPAGTVLITDGTASVPLAHAAWRREGAHAAVALAVAGARFAGRFAPGASGVWRLDVATADGSPIEGDLPTLALKLIADSAPVVTVAVPAADTTLPLTLDQPLVIDARDDHALTRVVLESWRVSQTGKTGDTVQVPLALSGSGDRAILQTELDARRRGLLPGDTLRFRIEAWDNAPEPHVGRSKEIALRLPTLEDLRAATRAATNAVSAQADSVAAAARSLAGDTRDLAAERSRRGAADSARDASHSAGSLSFEQTQRAAEIARRQEELGQRVQELSKAMDELSRAAQAAGVDDTAFQARLAEVQRLLAKAMTPELAQRLKDLQDAMARLDPDATRRALQRLADAQEELKQNLTRSEELFRRAAVEGQLSTLAAEAEDLRRRQAEWNAADAHRADSVAAARERALADRADSLAHALAQTDKDLSAASTDSTGGSAGNAVRQAQGAMQQAAGAALAGDANRAQQHGVDAEHALRGLPEALKIKRDSLVGAWKRETIEALDRALTETAELARRQQAVADALERGEGGASTRAAEASVEEGATAVARQIRDAAGKHALVSPGLDAALGFAQRQMAAARTALEQAQPNAQQAGELANEAVDALNATALALARSADDVGSAKSGSGLQEAIEQLAKMAGQQSGLNADAQGLMPMMGQGGDQILQQMRALAARQRALAEELERLQAGGATSAAGPLAEEARQLARQLDAGHLDPQTLARQQQLYRRLLDAGRSLTGPETDEQRDRVSRAALGDSVHLPAALRAGATGAAGIAYPSWAELQHLTPEQRRQVLEYFRRLNAPPAH